MAVTYKNHLCTFRLTVPSEKQSKIELKCVNLVPLTSLTLVLSPLPRVATSIP